MAPEKMDKKDSKEIPFLSFVMGAGEGKRKLGTALRLQEDVYATLFCGLIKAEYSQSIQGK